MNLFICKKEEKKVVRELTMETGNLMVFTDSCGNLVITKKIMHRMSAFHEKKFSFVCVLVC